MNLFKSVPKNKTIYFNGLQSHTTGSIPVSPTISTKIKYVRNNKDLACKLLKLLSYLKPSIRFWSDFAPKIIREIRSKIGVFSPKIVCKSLLDFFQQSQNKFSVTGYDLECDRLSFKNSLFLLVLVCENAYNIIIISETG